MVHKVSPTSSPTVVIYYLFDNSHLIDMRCYFVILICISLMINSVEHLFACGGHLYYFLRKMSSQILCQFFNWVGFCRELFCLFDVEWYEFFLYFGCQPLIRYIKYLPFSRQHFHFANSSLCCKKAFSFDIIPFVYFHFSCLRRQIQIYIYI